MQKTTNTNRRRKCIILSKVPSGPDDTCITVKTESGEICELYVDSQIIQDCPRYAAVYDFGTYLAWSDMLNRQVEAVEWLTYESLPRQITLN